MALRTPFANDAKSYGFEWLRAMLETGLQEGVLNMAGAGTDFKVTAAAAGAPLRVDVAAGAALTKGDSGAPGTGLSQGLYLTINDAAIANAVALAAADGSNPRLDQIALRIRDTSDLAGAADDATLVVLTGTPTSGATLDNRNGNAALPNDHLRLADVLVPAGATAVLAGNVRDRRPWARGARKRIKHLNAGNYSKTSASPGLLDATNLNPRLECSTGLLLVSFSLDYYQNATGEKAVFGIYADGNVADTSHQRHSNGVASAQTMLTYTADIAVTAGSHQIGPGFYSLDGATGIFVAGSPFPVFLSIREDLAPNADNG